MLLVAEHLTKTYAHRRGWSPAPGRRGVRDAVRPALADASLSLERGESVGIVGGSGSPAASTSSWTKSGCRPAPSIGIPPISPVGSGSESASHGRSPPTPTY